MSTPINRIPEDPHRSLDEDQETIQNIIQEIKDQENPPPLQQPIDQYEPSRPRRNPAPQRGAERFEYYEEDDVPYRENVPQEVRYASQQQPQTTNHISKQPSVSQSIWQKLWQDLKEPLLVLVLYVLSNLRVFDKIFMRYIPRVSNDIGTLNFMGILAKAIVITIIFFLFKKFIR
ncbi:MAG: hypothetical protein EOP45_23160 [Sphingobacteriaceae bacterium]|nr:MAG: hypothetical protein EOP45_23160 [Sphingobacteriaceae bacterium]